MDVSTEVKSSHSAKLNPPRTHLKTKADLSKGTAVYWLHLGEWFHVPLPKLFLPRILCRVQVTLYYGLSLRPSVRR